MGVPVSRGRARVKVPAVPEVPSQTYSRHASKGIFIIKSSSQSGKWDGTLYAMYPLQVSIPIVEYIRRGCIEQDVVVVIRITGSGSNTVNGCPFG